jgi:predicted nicotinamide N-methyase
MEPFSKENALRITEARYGEDKASIPMISVDARCLNKLLLAGDTMVFNRLAEEGKGIMWCTECGARANKVLIFTPQSHAASCDIGCWLAAADQLKVGGEG